MYSTPAIVSDPQRANPAPMEYRKNIFRNYSYPLHPTKKQAALLRERMRQRDDFFNKCAKVATSGALLGRPISEIENQINTLPCHYAALSNPAFCRALKGVRTNMIKLLHKLQTGTINWISPRSNTHLRKSLTFLSAKTSEQYTDLPTIGAIHTTFYRPLPANYRLCYVTVVEDCYGASFHITFTILYPCFFPAAQPVLFKNAIGLDYKQDGGYITSTGESGNFVHFREKAEPKLRRHYQAASRHHRGSRRWKKHMQRAAKCEKHIVNQRKHMHNILANRLARQYDAIFVENLDLASMKRDYPQLAKKINENAYSSFLRKLEHTCCVRGKSFIKVDHWYPSSQTCACCGKHIGKLPLEKRTVICPFCGTQIDRDHNAAINILKEGFDYYQKRTLQQSNYAS
ncbi:RNA-guided endonuclease InsQ/TnpB family protein [Agathobaculum sp. Marseille-P7918]|uniref:RNA-guided endonuclease InsQ/TnpB family protein n=1 Tax=Agathobaculum sp. Marseille-P7918 TaxID=2479843 RepID=UPI00356AFA74